MKVCPDPGLVRVVRRVQADAQSDANGGQAQGVWRFPPRVPQPTGWGGGQERPVMPCTGSVCVRDTRRQIWVQILRCTPTKNTVVFVPRIFMPTPPAQTVPVSKPHAVCADCVLQVLMAGAAERASTARHPRAPHQPSRGSLCQVELDSVAECRHAARMLCAPFHG